MSTTRLITIYIMVLCIAGCCNALKKSKAVRIPPYIVEYYHCDDHEKPAGDGKEPEEWYGYEWKNGFQMNFKVTRVEESGVYFYRLKYRATNPLQERIALFDQNIKLTDSSSGTVIEQLKCWNWQRVSDPCNVAYVKPDEEVSKEIRFGFSTDERYAQGIKIHVSGLSFDERVVSLSFYAKKPKDSL